MFHFYFHEIWQKVFRRKGKNGTVKGREEKKKKRKEGFGERRKEMREEGRGDGRPNHPDRSWYVSVDCRGTFSQADFMLLVYLYYVSSFLQNTLKAIQFH